MLYDPYAQTSITAPAESLACHELIDGGGRLLPALARTRACLDDAAACAGWRGGSGAGRAGRTFLLSGRQAAQRVRCERGAVVRAEEQ